MSNKKRISKEQEDKNFYDRKRAEQLKKDGKRRAKEAQEKYNTRKQVAQEKMLQKQKEIEEINNEIANKKFSKEKEIEHKKTLIRKRTSIKNPRNNFKLPRISSNQKKIFDNIDRGGTFKILKGGNGIHTNKSNIAKFGSSAGSKGKNYATCRTEIKSGAGVGKNNIKEYVRDLIHILRKQYILNEKLDQASLDILNDFIKLSEMSDEDINNLLNSNRVSNNIENIVLGLSDVNYEREFLSPIDFNEKMNERLEQVKKEYSHLPNEIKKAQSVLSQDAVNRLIYIIVDNEIENELEYKYKDLMEEFNASNIRELVRTFNKTDPEMYKEQISDIETLLSKTKPNKSKGIKGNVKRENLLKKYKDQVDEDIKKEKVDKNKKVEGKVKCLSRIAKEKGISHLIEPHKKDILKKVKRLAKLKEEKKEKEKKFGDLLNIGKSFNRKDYLEQTVIFSIDHYERLEKMYGAELAREMHMERLEEHMVRLSEKYGLECGALGFHLDEGHICRKTGKFSRNIHAHILFYNFDFRNNTIPTLQMNRKYTEQVSFEEHNDMQNALLTSGFGGKKPKKISYKAAGVQLFKETSQDMLHEGLFDELGYVRPLANKFKPNPNNDRQYNMKMKAVEDRKEQVKKQLKQEQERKNAELEKEKESMQGYQDEMEKLFQEEAEKLSAERDIFSESVKSQIEEINKDIQAQKDSIEREKQEIRERKSNYCAIDETIEELSNFFKESFEKMKAFPRRYNEVKGSDFNKYLMKYESMKMLGIQSNKVEFELSKILRNTQQMTSKDKKQMREQSASLFAMLIGSNADNRFKNIIKR